MDTSTILDFVREFQRKRGFVPRRVYMTLDEYREFRYAGSAPISFTTTHESDYGTLEGIPIRVSRAAHTIRDWDLH